MRLPGLSDLTYLNARKAFVPNLVCLQEQPWSERRAGPSPPCGGGETETMDQQTLWEKISTAPFDRDLELAVIERDHLHPLVFACRRTTSGWVKVANRERVNVSPTHWRLWRPKG
jgi:hypothetical protein